MNQARSVFGRAAALMVAAGLGLVGPAAIFAGLVKAAGDPPTPPGPASVRLLGPVSEIRGVEVPASILAGQRPHFFSIDGPAEVQVTLPGGRVVSNRIKSADIVVVFDPRAKAAVVVDVELLPLMKSVPYREAVAEVRRGLGAMGITPDEAMRRRMATWPEDSPGASGGVHPHSFRARMALGEFHGIRVDLRPSPDGGWFVVYTLEANAEARRALWDPTFRATAKP